MNSVDFKYIQALKFSSSEISILKTLGEYKGKEKLYFQQTPEILTSLRQTAIIESSESSNRIEGITAPRKRVADLVLKSSKPQNRSEQEIAGYRDALDLIHESASFMELSTNVILQLHKYIYKYVPGVGGQWKITNNDIVEKYPDGEIKRVRFTPVSAVQTPQAMEDLVNNYSKAIHEYEREPLLVIPLAIFDFLCVHPFSDGNGRVARLLTLLLLYHFDFQVGKYISLERIFEDSKETYYESLEKSSKGWHQKKHDIFPWLTYFWGVLIRAYKEFEERVGVIQTARGVKTDLIIKAIDRKIKPFAISDIEAECPSISRDMIRVVIRKLRDKGIIIQRGKGRGSKWAKGEGF